MDRITRLRIKNVRAIESLDLEVSPLTVLIGENGAGKSTIIECLEILRKAADANFFQQFYSIHRGMPGLLRKGATALSLGVVIEDEADPEARIEYDFDLHSHGAGAVVGGERLRLGVANPVAVIDRTLSAATVLQDNLGEDEPIKGFSAAPDRLAIASFGTTAPHPALARVLAVLGGAEIHLHFDTVAAWAARSYQFSLSIRGSTTHFPADRVSLLGFNLANAWSALKNRDSAHWEQTVALVRLGLGLSVDTVQVTPDPGGGNVFLSLKFADFSEAVPAANLSDGQLAWLGFVAMTRLNEGRSLLAVDEPELHMHPQLIGGVITLLEALKPRAPVIIATHSDRVLELIHDPAAAVRVCTLEAGGRATISRIDAGELTTWLKHFGDFGRLRASGYLPRVLKASSIAPGEGRQ